MSDDRTYDSDEWDARLKEFMPSVGESYRVDFGKGHFANKLIHVRAVVDDEYVVCRHWKHGRWVYELTDATFFLVYMQSGHMKKVKSK